MTKFKMQYEGSVDGFYAMLDKLANDSRVSIKVEMEVFVHPSYPSEDWGDPYWDEDRAPPERDDGLRQMWDEYAASVPASSPPAEQPSKTLGQLLTEKLGDKLREVSTYDNLAQRCVKAMGFVFPSSNALLLGEKVRFLLPEARAILDQKGWQHCVQFLDERLWVGIPSVRSMVEILLAEPRPVMGTPPGCSKPLQVAVEQSYAELAKECMQFVSGAFSNPETEKSLARLMPEVLNIIRVQHKAEAIEKLRSVGCSFKEAEAMVAYLATK